jgi:hypothetical protein
VENEPGAVGRNRVPAAVRDLGRNGLHPNEVASTKYETGSTRGPALTPRSKSRRLTEDYTRISRSAHDRLSMVLSMNRCL